MSKQSVYELLEDKMLRYADLIEVPVEPIDESLVEIVETNNLLVDPIDGNMAAYTGDKIYVRQSVVRKLGQASLVLAETDPDLQLQVVYGYRALSIQTARHEMVKASLAGEFTGLELIEAVHRKVAVPEVAGHPTGGAVDVQLLRAGQPLDFGTRISEFVPDAYTFSPFVSREVWFNRQLLRRVMTETGFAPFDGEWWHYSYGDREWAKYYNKPAAIYEQVEFRV